MFIKESKEKNLSISSTATNTQSVTHESTSVQHNFKDFEKISRPDHISEKHWKELVYGSCINPEIARLNFISVYGNLAYDLLLYSAELNRTNTGRLNYGTLKRYEHLEKGGWYAGTLNILSEEESLWGCFKPDHPRESDEGKTVKYEHPPKTSTQAFFLKVPPSLWENIAGFNDKTLPKNYKELPYVAFWHWVREYNLPIIIVEGVKKAAALLSLGFIAIGIPGIYSGYRQPKNEYGERDGKPSLTPEIKYFANPDRVVNFCFDQDTKRSTVRAVNLAIEKTAKLLTQDKCQVRIMTWNNLLGKGIDDVLVGTGNREIIDEIYREARDLNKWQIAKLKQLTYEPNILLNERYIPESLEIPADQPLICVISPKNTGKSTFIQRRTARSKVVKVKLILNVTHRDSLSRKLAYAFDIPYIADEGKEDLIKHYGVSLVIDSLHPKSQAKFNPEDWYGATIILDEVEQQFWHMLSSTTCRNDRVAIFKSLREVFRVVIKTGGEIIVADADLRDTSLDFLKELTGIEPYIIENQYKFDEKPWKVHNYSDKNPARIFYILKQQLSQGKKILLNLSGQKAQSKWGSTVLEADLKKAFPNLRILRIDSHTVANPKHPACGILENINEEIVNYDLVIATPTIETGVSIEVEHFDAVFGIFMGVQSTDSVRQHLSRYRPSVPRYVFISKTGFNYVGNGSDDVNQLLNCEYKKNRMNIQSLARMGFEESLDGNGLENIFIKTWAKNAAIINAGMRHYREQILADLKEEGHIIIDVKPDEKEEYDAKVTEQTRDEVYAEENQKIADAPLLDDDAYKKLSKQRAKTDEQRMSVRRTQLEKTYRIEVTQDLVVQDDKEWFSKIQLEYFIHNPEFLKDREKNIMSNALEAGTGDYFIPDSNRLSLSTKVNTLVDVLQIKKLLETEGLHEQHPVAVKIGGIARDKMFMLKNIGINLTQPKKKISEIKNMSICHALIHMLGLKFPRVGRTRNTLGKLIWVYGLPAPGFKYSDDKQTKIALDEDGKPIAILDQRQEVFAKWTEKNLEEREKLSSKLDAAQLAAAYKAELIAEFNQGNRENALNLVENLKAMANEATNNLEQVEQRQVYAQTLEETWSEIGKDVKAHQMFPDVYQARAKAQPKVQQQPQPKAKQVTIANTLEARAINCENPKQAANLIREFMHDENALMKVLYMIGDTLRNKVLASDFFHEITRQVWKNAFIQYEQALAA